MSDYSGFPFTFLRLNLGILLESGRIFSVALEEWLFHLAACSSITAQPAKPTYS